MVAPIRDQCNVIIREADASADLLCRSAAFTVNRGTKVVSVVFRGRTADLPNGSALGRFIVPGGKTRALRFRDASLRHGNTWLRLAQFRIHHRAS